MTERASLKSYGRFECGQEQLFYELILNDQQYLLKYYNEMGKLKMIRPLKIPTEGIEIHTAGNYLFCYLHSFENQVDSEVIITKLDTCIPHFKSCKFNFSCKTATNQALALTYFHEQSQTFICVDERQHVYILPNLMNPFFCKKIYENDKIINRIQVNRDNNIVLTTEERHLKILQMNWGSQECVNFVVKINEVDFYLENNYEVYFVDDNPEQLGLDRAIKLSIKEKYGEFTSFLKKDSDLIFFSSKKDFFIAFDSKHHLFVCLIEGIFKTYEGEKEDRKVPQQLKSNNFTVLYKKDKSRNILIQLRVYNEITSEFNCTTYNLSEMGKQLKNLSFLRKNIEKILNFNGLIDPLYQQLVQKALKQLEDNASNFDKERKQEQLTFIDLSVSLMKNGLLYFPNEMKSIIQKIKRHIMNIKQTYYIIESKRLFEYCSVIQNEIALDLKNIYEERNKIFEKGEVDNNIECQFQCKTQKYNKLLSNMIHFLVLLIKELQTEYQHLEFQNLEDYQRETLLSHLQDYKEVRDNSKSLFLIIKLLEDKDIRQKILLAFNLLAEKRTTNYQIWQNHHRLVKMEYPPLLLHEHFRNISHLTKGENHKPNYCQFFYYLLENRSNFIEVSYFFQLVAKVVSVPFLDTDTSDLLQNILFHTQVIPQTRNQHELKEDPLRISDLIHKMAGTAIKTGQYTLIKYMIQQAISYKYFALAVMLIHSESYHLKKEDLLSEKQHIFMMKSLLLAEEFNMAHLYTLKHYSDNFFQDFVRFSKLNDNLPDLLQLKLKNKGDNQTFFDLLDLDSEQEVIFKDIQDEM